MTIERVENTGGSLAERMDYARALAEASIIPKAFQRKPADVLVAIEYGNALGIDPIVALTEINVIQGTPALSASLMAARARAAGHKVRIKGDAHSATCTIIRADDPDEEITATWDEQKARDAGLLGKGHWSKDPGTMLKWRAIAECVRFACSEVLGGLKYSTDEVRDFKPTAPTIEAHPATPAKQQPRSGIAAAKALAKAAPQPPTEQLETENTVTWNDVESCEDVDQLRAMWKRAPEELKSAIEARVEDLKTDAADPDTGEIVDAELVDPWQEGDK